MAHKWTRVFAVIAIVATVLIGATASAFAAGDLSVDRLIVTDAFPGWTKLPPAVLQQTLASERTAMANGTDKATNVAVNGWRKGNKSIVVVLIEFPDGAPSGIRPRDAVAGACTAATQDAPPDIEPFGGIDNSSEATCSGSIGGVPISAAVMSWQNEDIVALVVGVRFSKAELQRFAVKQNLALPGADSQLGDDSDSSSSSWEIIAIIVAVVVVGAAVIFLLIARSRSKMPAPVQALGGSSAPPWSTPASSQTTSAYAPPTGSSTFAAPTAPAATGAAPGAASPFSSAAPPAPAPPPQPTPAPAPAAPGWQPVNGDPAHIAYWDGNTYTAWKRWDGASWVD